MSRPDAEVIAGLSLPFDGGGMRQSGAAIDAGAAVGSGTVRVEAPGAWAADDEIEEDEAIEDRRIAAVVDREEILGRVNQPVSDRHRAGGDKGGRTREQAESDE